MQGFYTYIWFREDGTPYYVGKGHGKRAFTGNSHNVKCPKDSTRIQVYGWPDEATAYAYEMYLIAFWGRKDLGTGCLRNRSDGGENPPSWRGKKRGPMREEHLRKLKAVPHTWGDKISKAKMGRPSPKKGIHSEISPQTVRAGAAARWAIPGAREAMSRWSKLRWETKREAAACRL